MIESLRQKQNSLPMVKHFLLMALLFPLYSTSVNVPYSPDIVYPNLFVVLFLAFSLLEGNLAFRKKDWLVWALALGLLGFNLFSFYVNFKYFGWYYGQANVTIGFLFFLGWLSMKDTAPGKGEDMVRFFLGAAVITNLIGIAASFLGYEGFQISVDGYYGRPVVPGDKWYSWIYSHKSEYSFTLVLFLALTVTYRRLFKNRLVFWGSIGVFVLGLLLSQTRATQAAALLILVGVLADYLKQRFQNFSWKHLLWFLPIVIAGCIMLWYFSKDRDIWTLGKRTHIWKAAVAHILDNPLGVGAMCGLQPFPAENLIFEPQNCHNVFLNILLQYSIPAGGLYLLMLGAIVVEAIRKNPSFLTFGILGACFIPMMMDWCMLPAQLPQTLMAFYFLFFHPLRKQ